MFKNSLPVFFRQIYTVFNTKQKKQFILVLLLILVQSIFEVAGLGLILPLLYVAQFPEKISSNEYLEFVYIKLGFLNSDDFTIFLACVLFITFVLKGLYSIWLIGYQTKLSHEISSDLIQRQISTGLRMDYYSFKSKNSNVLVQDMVTVPIEFASFVVQPLLLILSETVVVALISIGVAFFDLKIFLALIFILLPPLVIFQRVTRKKIVQLGIDKNALRPDAYKHVFTSVHGIESVKITHSESYFERKIIESFRQLFKKMAQLVVIENIPIRIIELAAISAVCFIVIYTVIFKDVSKPILPLLIVFATAAYRLMPSMNRILSSAVRIKGSKYVLNRIQAFSDHKSARSSDDDDSEVLRFSKSIKFQCVTFKYPGDEKMVLNGIDFEIKKGEFVGIIGKTGQGKSTLLRIFLKLLEPDDGNIYCDDELIDLKKNRAWQSMIGYVQQSVFLMDGTIAENIAFGEDVIDCEKVERCIKLASLDTYVAHLKDGQESLVGEFGSSISGGQRQRLAIARALYKHAQILVLDEATSSLDNETEKSIMKTLEELKSEGLTVIIVAHRIASLYACDRIIEIGKGGIKRELTYDELVVGE